MDLLLKPSGLKGTAQLSAINWYAYALCNDNENQDDKCINTSRSTTFNFFYTKNLNFTHNNFKIQKNILILTQLLTVVIRLFIIYWALILIFKNYELWYTAFHFPLSASNSVQLLFFHVFPFSLSLLYSPWFHTETGQWCTWLSAYFTMYKNPGSNPQSCLAGVKLPDIWNSGVDVSFIPFVLRLSSKFLLYHQRISRLFPHTWSFEHRGEDIFLRFWFGLSG